LTSIFDSAVINMCGGDELRARYGCATAREDPIAKPATQADFLCLKGGM
jgi:hypothetical protein